MRRQSALPAALFLLLSSTGLPAQQATFRSKIELVNIDVVVVDKDGNAVRGLKASDFALTDRKKPQTIANFEEVSHERAANAVAVPTLPPTLRLDVATNTTVQADRLVMVVVDDLHIWKGRTDKAKALARDIVIKLGTQASMAMIFTSREGSTQVTQDRSELLAAIDGMQARQTFRRPHQGFVTQKAAYVDPEAPAEIKFDAINTAQMASLQDFEDNLQYITSLQEAAKMLLREDNRRKAFVVISEGMMVDMAALSSGASHLAEIVGQGSDPSTTKPANRNEEMGMMALRDMSDAFRRANVALYAIDPRGKVRPEDMMLESWPPIDCAVCNNPPKLPTPSERVPLREDSQFAWNNPVRLAQEGLGFMSEAAGGFAVTDTDDLTGGLNRILEDLDHYYLLGFYPSDVTGSGTHPVDLTVPGHPDYKVRFRRGFTIDAPKPSLKSKDPLLELATSVMPRSDLPMRLTAQPLVGIDKKSSVVVALEITAPVGQMKEADAKLRDDVTYQVMVIDEKKAKVTQREGRAAKFSMVARDPSKPEPDAVTYQIPLTIDLNPGRYQLRASAISKKLDKGGSVYLDIVVPDYLRAPLAITNISLGYADGTRVPVGRTRTVMLPSSRPGMAPAPDVALPPAQERAQNNVNLLPFEPTLSREFEHTDALRVYFEVARADAKSTVAMTITILDAENQPLLAFDKSVGPSAPGKVDLRIPLDKFGPGAFVLRVAATDSRNVAKAETGFIVK
ncbi:MAG: VWA domain-containing protein [Acidobacteriota bacterium]